MSYGLPAAGCLDTYSHWLANWLVGNSREAPVLEITLMGPEFEIHRPVCVGITGAVFDIFVNEQRIDSMQTIQLFAGDRLRFGRLLNGCRAYLAVSGGIIENAIWGSVSTYLPAKIGGLQGRCLRKGDPLYSGPSHQIHRELPNSLRIAIKNKVLVRIVDGAESVEFSEAARRELVSQPFTVSVDSNRMGCRLQGQPLIHQSPQGNMVTTGVAVGSIQVPSDGQPIVIMADGQTTGGYPRIANVITADRHLMAQVKPGDKVSFYRVNLAKATRIYRQKQQFITQQLALQCT